MRGGIVPGAQVTGSVSLIATDTLIGYASRGRG
jgi:hypothetical protein